MVYYKLLLDCRKKTKSNLYSVVVRVTHNKKSTTITTGVRIAEKDWDPDIAQVRNTSPNCLSLNSKVAAFYSKIQKLVLELDRDDSFDFEALKDRLNGSHPVSKSSTVLQFKHYSQGVIEAMLSINKAGNAMIYQTAVNQLMAYADKPNLKFTEITYSFLEGFKRHLIKKGLKTNSISNYFRTIRAIYNKAIKEKLVDRSTYPFSDISIKTEPTAKRAISLDELKEVIKLELKPNSPEWKARCYFLLSFSLRGISFVDLAYLKPEQIKKGYLIYKRRKTGKELRVKLLPYAVDLFSKLKGNSSNYLLPVLPNDTIENGIRATLTIGQWIKTTNKYLKRIGGSCKIDQDVTTYVIRHTFATSAKKKLGYSNELIAEYLGHEYGNKITNIYLDSFDQVLIDEVGEKMIKLITDQ